MGVLEPFTPPNLTSTNAAIAAAGTERTPLLGDQESQNAFNKHDQDEPNPDVQEGVQTVEAITLVWSKTSLRLTYCL